MKYKIGTRDVSYGEEWRENIIVDEKDLDKTLRKILLEDGLGIYEVEEYQTPNQKVIE